MPLPLLIGTGRELMGLPPAGPVTLLFDQFTDADNTNIASHTIAPTNTVAAAWNLWRTGANAAIQIETNTADTTNNDSSGNQHGAWADSTKADCTVTADCVLDSGQSFWRWGLCARFLDTSNYWEISIDNSGSGARFIITEHNAGVETVRATTSFSPASPSTHTMQVVLTGSTITATLDGGNSISYGSAALNQTGTKHGLFNVAQNGFLFNGRWDNFKVTSS